MPGTTRYSATFDRTYEEDDRADPAPPANARRSRSLSWQAHSGLDGGRPYTPLGFRQQGPRSSSTDNGPSKPAEHIPTRTVAKTPVKAHNNPFQFVKVGTCPLYKKAEEQLKKTKEVKKQDVLKEEEEEWQSNLDSWKSRRRKMSEDVFRRQEEIRQFELEEQNNMATQKKTKTFSEMVNSRATRGRALSLCLISSPLDFQDWEFENKSLKNGSCSTFTDESEGNSTVNSEDEGVSMRGRLLHLDNQNNHTNGNAHIEQNSLKLETHNGNYNKLDLTASNGQIKAKEGSYIDSGLESISSSHRAGDTPDSGSDFSQDSNSSIDCDSPRAGVNILEEFSSKSLQISPGQELNMNITLTDKAQEFGFSFRIDKDAGRVLISSVLEGSKAESSGVHLEDQITAVDGIDINSKNHAEISSMINKAKEKGKITLLLWRHSKTTNGLDSIVKHVDNSIKENEAESDDAKYQQYEKSIESENEMYVDDFEELQRQSELLKSNKPENTSTKSQAQSNGNISATTNSSNKISIKTSAPKLKETIQNGAVDEKNKINTDSNPSTENQKKNIIKVKRVRKKGVCGLDVSANSNQIPQATPVNCLYPLSPVTELPSPADETKTMSSSLSSNPSTPESNSEKDNTSKKILKEADAQLNSSVMEKNKTAVASKSDVSKTATPCDKPKSSSLNKVEGKTECSNVPSSPTLSTAKDSKLSLENSQEEKAQVPSSPKKLKIKVKKANMSSEQKSPETSPTAKEVVLDSSGTKILDSPVDKKVTPGNKLIKKISSDFNSKDNQVNVVKSEKVESSEKESNIVASEASDITSVEKSSSKYGSVATASSDKTRNLSLQIDTKVESVVLPTASNVNKPPKTPTDEKSKPMKSKKEKTNFKGSFTLSSENTDTTTEVKEKPQSCDAGKNLLLKTNKLDQPACKNETSAIAKIKQTETAMEEKSKHATASENKTKLKAEAKNKSPDVIKESPISCISPIKKEEISTSISEPKGAAISNDNASSKLSTAMVNTSETVKVLPKGKSIKVRKGNAGSELSFDKVSNLSAKFESKIEAEKLIPVTLAAKSKLAKTSKDERVNEPLSEKKEKPLLKENTLSTKNISNSEDAKETSVCNDTTSSDKTKKLSLNIDTSKESLDKSASPTVAKMKSPKTPQDEKLKPSFARKKDQMKSKNINSQNVIAPAKQNEDNLNSNIESLNIVFQSEPKNTLAKNQSKNIVSIENNSNKKTESDLVPDILPVEKVAEEMEKLILEQLEEEERAKELATEIKCTVGTSEHLLIAPPKLAEPPKEKPPPPPTANEGNQKETSLKRVNSTKRIKKEIHKRRSNFLGIDSVDESLICGESSVPPPPALEEILKAEMELDRQSRLKIENAATERLTLEEKEIMEKEREIIETLESEERMKNLINGTEMYNDASPTSSSDMTYEEDCIFSMKNEQKRIDAEHVLSEEQQLNFLEENQLREREEFIRKQEVGNSTQSIAGPSLSVAVGASTKSQSALSSLTDKNSKVSLSDSNGDGKNLSSNSSMAVSENKSSDCLKKVMASEKPAVPPKPLKKKEAIRKERERLRQEQEALQREREEHRRKLMFEQEELKKQQKSHAPEASVSRLGPIPSLIPPNYPSQLTTTTTTTTMNATPNARESASFPSRSHHGDTNGIAGSNNSAELMGPPIVRQGKVPPPRKAVQSEAWGQQKMPSVRKQNQDSLTESRYNQNHWLIQEAEMRRIAELKERQQRVSQLPCSQTHLAEDDVCSNPPRVPVIPPPPHNPHVNYAAAQDKMWNYGQTNLPSKKYPPAVAKDLLHTVYPRETVSQQAPTKPSRVVPLERQEQMLSVSGRKRCSHCNEELGRGAAMIIESLQLYYHIHCFQCCVCQAQLGNGSCGTDVRVRNNKLHCHNCYSNDEAGLKFSQV